MCFVLSVCSIHGYKMKLVFHWEHELVTPKETPSCLNGNHCAAIAIGDLGVSGLTIRAAWNCTIRKLDWFHCLIHVNVHSASKLPKRPQAAPFLITNVFSLQHRLGHCSAAKCLCQLLQICSQGRSAVMLILQIFDQVLVVVVANTWHWKCIAGPRESAWRQSYTRRFPSGTVLLLHVGASSRPNLPFSRSLQ